MNRGITVQELATEVERQNGAKQDFVLDSHDIDWDFDLDNPGHTVADLGAHGSFPVLRNAHKQLAAHMKVPQAYYDRMVTDAPLLWRDTMDHWLSRNNTRRMVRMLDGEMRAFLSDRYNPLDNADMMEAVMPVLAEKDVTIVSAQVTPQRLYVKFIDPKLRAKVDWKGPVTHRFANVEDEIVWGGMITNSEVGAGSLAVSTMFVRSICDNTAIVGTDWRKYHVGSTATADDAQAYLRDETRKAKDQATFLELRDTVEHALSTVSMEATVRKLSDSTGHRIDGDVHKGIEVVGQQIGLNESEKGSVLQHLIEGGDLSQWGVANAVTRTAEDADSYDRATELEAAGMKVIDLTAGAWREVAEAAA
jgi:hypothetical protein